MLFQAFNMTYKQNALLNGNAIDNLPQKWKENEKRRVQRLKGATLMLLLSQACVLKRTLSPINFTLNTIIQSTNV